MMVLLEFGVDPELTVAEFVKAVLLEMMVQLEFVVDLEFGMPGLLLRTV